MAKKSLKRVKPARKSLKKQSKPADPMVAVQGWMFVVAFALMLGIGAVVGTYFNKVLDTGVGAVAGAQTEYYR